MPKYVLLSKFKQAFDLSTLPPEEAKNAVAPWYEWFASMGPAVKETVAFKFGGKSVSGDGSKEADNLHGGYVVIEADSLSEAAELAKGAPNVASGQGSVEVYEVQPTDS